VEALLGEQMHGGLENSFAIGLGGISHDVHCTP
jgi:hypothetical protein